jgi:hypothetical protein
MVPLASAAATCVTVTVTTMILHFPLFFCFLINKFSIISAAPALAFKPQPRLAASVRIEKRSRMPVRVPKGEF